MKAFLGNFDCFELERILKLENENVDALAKLGSMKASSKNQSVIQLVMLAPSIENSNSMCVNRKGVGWIPSRHIRVFMC